MPRSFSDLLPKDKRFKIRQTILAPAFGTGDAVTCGGRLVSCLWSLGVGLGVGREIPKCLRKHKFTKIPEVLGRKRRKRIWYYTFTFIIVSFASD